jgi:hypothetical protein
VGRLRSGEGHAATGILLLQIGKIGKCLGLAHTGSERIQDILNSDKHAAIRGRPRDWSGLNVMRFMTESRARVTRTANRFATALSAVDLDDPATVRGHTSGTVVVPRIVGPIETGRAGALALTTLRVRSTVDRRLYLI